MSKTKVGFDEIENFLEGRDPQKYIVGIEATYHKNEVQLIINDPEKGKYIETHSYKPFLWVMGDIADYMYGGSRSSLKKAMKKYGIKFKALRIDDENGVVPKRMEDGFKFMAECTGSYSDMLNFFKNGGLDVYSKTFIPNTEIEQRSLFVAFPPDEQFLISTGKRLFKGIDDYSDIHKMQFDLETEGLDPSVDPIFQIGIKDNRGYERVLEVKGDTHQERRDSERIQIVEFFNIIYELKPDIITAYNSEFFDWPYLERRCERLSIDITEIAKTLNPNSKFRRKPSRLKVGSETIDFDQTIMWGFNIIDISHTVRKTMAINSNIKSWSLKYITKFAGVAKPNRVYVEGDKIHSTWADTEPYAFNDIDGTFYKISEERPLEEGYVVVKGDYIVQRYLIDDLWETEQVDNKYNQAAFLVGKLLPTSYVRSSTMGTAGQWKLIMAAWSYEKGLGIPALTKKRDFVGGLSRLLEVGYAKNVDKFDYAALYPKTQLTWGIFPDLDISSVMEGLLTYIVDTRDEFKFKAGNAKSESERLQKLLDENREKLTPERIAKAEEMIAQHKRLASDFDKKQLPLKILANSFFGAYGAPYLFNWGDSDCAEETTCRGRQSLRLMVRVFKEYGFRPLVGDSVTGRSPIYIKYIDSGLVDIIPIQDAFNKNTDGERDFSEKPYLILTKNGWVSIDYVYRHATNKPIHRISTRDRFVECTSDHSLFSNGVEVKPSELKRDDKLDVYDFSLPTDVDVDLDEAWLLGFFVADGSSVYTNRTQKYFSKRKNTYVEHMGKRSEWTLNNTDYSKLEKAKNILDNMFRLDVPIKDYINSSNVFKLKTHYRKVAEWFSTNCYDNSRVKTIPIKILNGSLEVKKSFMDGLSAGDGWGDDLNSLKNITQKTQNVMAGVNLILKDLGIDFTLKLRKDKESIIAFNLGEKYKVNKDKSPRCTDKVWGNDIITNPDNYVYDISADGTFICGVGGVICHNTDGFNFARPDEINDYTYVAKGDHWKTEGQGGKTLKGVDAVLAEFNETYMEGRMGLDLDDVCSSTINFARKNYANAIDGKVKLVGNTVKSNKMPIYIEEFLDNGIKMLLDGDGYGFINYYYDYVEKIYNYQIPLMKIASKSKVKKSVDAYKKHINGKNKAGNSNPRQAHMELILKNNVVVSIGDIIYYVNTGDSKTTPDLKTVTDKETNTKTIELNCTMISREQMEKNPDMTTDDYNVAKYINAFNKRIRPLLVSFSKDIREKQVLIEKGVNKGKYKTIDNILLDVITVKDKKTNKTHIELEPRKEFTERECQLVAGHPYEEGDQDSFDDLMTMEDKEIRFWTSVNKLPNFMEQDEWDVIVSDYNERLRIAKEKGIEDEKLLLDSLFKMVELKELNDISTYGLLPIEITRVCDLYFDEETAIYYLRSKKWDVNLCKFDEIWRYEEEAKKRDEFYKTTGNGSDSDRYEQWINHTLQQEFLYGTTGSTENNKIGVVNIWPLLEREEKITEADDYVEKQELKSVVEWMGEQGFIDYIGDSFIKQEWVDNKEPYDRMAIPYKRALDMYNNRNSKIEMSEAIEEHKRNVKENVEDDEFNF